jgi:dipeptidyl aminopeptidase/acylaminoacyl peptidase
MGLLVFTAMACEDNINNDLQEEQSTEQGNFYEVVNENIIVGEGTPWELPGILSLPSGFGGKVPAVVLVHGSGPQDMDSTLYENKPFRDIADYLASRGIAVIRYDKRTLAHGAKIAQELGGNATVYEETIEDAILAAEILKADPRIDENKIFMAGLSMGGMLAPRIHAEGGNFAGIISLAGSPRSIHDISYDQQMAYVEAMPDGDEKNNYLALLDKELYDAELAKILNLPDDEAKNSMRPGGVSAYYYKDWDKIPTPEYVKNINVPFLIMQGSADVQVFADKDFAAWQELLAGRENATFKLYENLNHIFMQSAGYDITEAIEKEYRIKGNVDGQVLQDIADWIKAN